LIQDGWMEVKSPFPTPEESEKMVTSKMAAKCTSVAWLLLSLPSTLDQL
jgi:hypothetical protein